MIPPFKCTGCGKFIALAPGDSGQRIVCSACGSYLQAPVFQTQPPSQSPIAQLASVVAGTSTVGSAVRSASADREPSHGPLKRTPPESTEPPPRTSRWTLALIVALIWAIALIALVWYMAKPAPDPWEIANTPRLLAMKSDAESLARQGKLPDAHSKYAELQQEVGLHEIRDPKLKEQLDAAKSAQELLFAKLVDRATPAPPAMVDAIPPINQVLNPTTRPTQAATAPAPEPQPPPVIVQAPPQTPPTQVIVERPLPPTTRSSEPPPAAIVQRPQRPPTRKTPIPGGGITDQEIGDAIQAYVNEILADFDGPRLKMNFNNPYGPGLEVLAVYSLLQAGEAISDERLNVKSPAMKAMLNHIRDLNLNGRYETYARGLRATALSVYNRPEDREVLKKDVAWLIAAHHLGGYSYGVTRSGWDNSNSQYGLLGVWSGAEVGAEVPSEYWVKVQNHWQECQYDDGEFGYGRAQRQDARLSMTVAGIASLFVTHDYLDAPRFGSQVGRDPFGAHVALGLKYLEAGDNCISGHSGGYSLYGLERVGLASGFKYFGVHDWYRELAQTILAGGGWNGRGMPRLRFGRGDLVENSYTLLFLARGRHPILMNKLRFDGYWANRPRDVANLARFASRELERPINWQVVPIARDWSDWNDSPILYIASHLPIAFKEGDYVKMRRFVDAGGMIFTQADGNSEKFNTFVPEMAHKVFPGFEFRDMPADHEIYNLNFQVNPKPRLRYLTNGSRVLWVHSPEDIAMHWQLRAEQSKRNIFELGLNLFIYAGGKSNLRNRLSSNYIPEPRQALTYKLRIARIRYGGLWDPEPMAFERFAHWFSFQTGYDLVVSHVNAAELDPKTYPIAHLTGTVAWTASDADVAAFRKYVEDGGVLLIDACGGAAAFGNSMSNNLLVRAFAGDHLELLPPDHPLLAGAEDGMDPLKLIPRPFAEQKLGRGGIHMQVLSHGKGKVIYSAVDLTTGLLGTNTWGVLGYKPESCQSFIKNVLLWAADGTPTGK